jgi:hypothetical protein
MSYTLRDYQKRMFDDAKQFFATAKPGDKRCYGQPTGTGKSYEELALLETYSDSAVITPKIEIIAGLLEKQGYPEATDMPQERLIELAATRRIFTPIRLRNQLLKGEGFVPEKLIFDEGHHHTSESWQCVDLLTGRAPAIALTATPYRGTPRGTAHFLKQWGEPVWVITYPQAVEMGVLSFPRIIIQPLIDDDVIEVINGEFVVSKVEGETRSKIDNIVQLAMPYHCQHGRRWKRPTMFTVPSRDLAYELAQRLSENEMPACPITDATTHKGRQNAFACCLRGETAIVQVNTISEGVDLAIRVHFDLSPVMSPVMFLQRFGRTTRPVSDGEESPVYVCCNRNVLRHAYLLEGCIPPAVIREGTEAFGGPGKRMAARVVGLEGVGRFKAIELPFANGLVGMLYCLSSVEGSKVTEYAAIVHPLREEPVWAMRGHVKRPDGTRQFGRWQACSAPESLDGFASLPNRPMSPKQEAWYRRDAKFYGLDGTAKVTSKNFQALPVLADLRMRIRA